MCRRLEERGSTVQKSSILNDKMSSLQVSYILVCRRSGRQRRDTVDRGIVRRVRVGWIDAPSQVSDVVDPNDISRGCRQRSEVRRRGSSRGEKKDGET